MSDALKAVRLKLLRVEKQIQEIQSCVDVYSARHPHKISFEPNRKPKFNVTAPKAIDVSVIAGEAIYQMRSALDHLAFELVKKNPMVGTMFPKWKDNCQFPIRVRFPKNWHGPAPIPPAFFDNEVPGISLAAYAFIESVQPYYRVGAPNNCLRILHDLSNIDKHRHITTTRHRGQIYESRTLNPDLDTRH